MPEETPVDKRSEPRHGVSLPVWWQIPGQTGLQHGWMLDVSRHGAALLTPSRDGLAVGDRLNISLIDPRTTVDPDVAPNLLSRAPVCRLDRVASSLDRVALHFDEDLWRQDKPTVYSELTAMLADEAAPEPDRFAAVEADSG